MSSSPPTRKKRRPFIRRARRAKDTRPPALAPGTLIHVGEKLVDELEIRCLRYDDTEVSESTTHSIEQCLQVAQGLESERLWLKVTGLHEVEKIGELLTGLGVHALVQEDILNTNQRIKVEDFDSQIFLSLKSIVLQQDHTEVRVEQLSMLLSDRLVITFEESTAPVFDPVIQRLKKGSGRLRRNGSDYLVWGLLDAVVDHYIVSISNLGAEIESIDAALTAHETSVGINEIHDLKAQALHLQHLIRPVREVVGHLERGESSLLGEKNRIYFRDLYDHTIHAIEEVEMLRESVNSLRDYYLSAMSNRMNEVMKVLTCISTIFLPLTFLAGIYGMNFETMPELKWPWAYPILWVFFLTAAGGMALFFRKKKWL